MSGWHPNLPDGALAPNPNDPGNPAQAFNPVTPPHFASPLYYGNGCDVRLRPHVMNSLISENLAVLDRVGMAYNPGTFFNTRTAIEYIVQRGLPKACLLAPQGYPPYYYRGVLDPPIAVGGPNNGMVLLVVPTETNRGWIRIDVGHGWWVPVLRNDREELRREDWDANVPQLIGYLNGAWYMLGLCKSQVPLVLIGAINFWIRWDGNDEEGDGTENTPQKAFRTIAGAWHAVGSRYAGSPGAAIILRLGIAGEYEGCTWLGPFGSTVQLYGDPSNPAAYRIMSKLDLHGSTPFLIASIFAAGVNNMAFTGVNFVVTHGQRAANMAQCLRIAGCQGARTENCIFTFETGNPEGNFIVCYQNTMLFLGTRNTFRGNGHTIAYGINLFSGGNIPGEVEGFPLAEQSWENVTFTGTGIHVNDRSYFGNNNIRVGTSGTQGQRYYVGGWSNFSANGQPIPGSLPGYADPRSGNFWP